MFKYIARTFPQFEESLGLTDEDRANKANETKNLLTSRDTNIWAIQEKQIWNNKWFSSK